MVAPFYAAERQSPICNPPRAAGCKWGKDNFTLGISKNIHPWIVFPFPKFRVVRHASRGKDGMGLVPRSINMKAMCTSLPKCWQKKRAWTTRKEKQGDL